jgi:hypothetical protein
LVLLKLRNGGQLNANRFELINSGDLVRFDGGMVLTINPAQRQTTGGPQCRDRAAEAGENADLAAKLAKLAREVQDYEDHKSSAD